MLSVGIIGCGNAGGQNLALAESLMKVDCLAINSSEDDLATLPDTISKILLGASEGSGKDRIVAKQFFKEKLNDIIKNENFAQFMDKDVVFVISSTGGGTGSGISLMLVAFLRKLFPDTIVIPVGILPLNKEGYVAEVNSLSYLYELYSILKDGPYMLYENEKYNEESSISSLTRVNEDIINDLRVISGEYNYPTKSNAIDNRELKKLISAPGRIVVGRTNDFRIKDVEDDDISDIILSNIKNSSAVSIERAKKIFGIGIITNIEEDAYNIIDTSLSGLQEYVGEAAYPANHNSVNVGDIPNNIYVILSGLKAVDDKILYFKEKVEKFESEQSVENESVESSVIYDIELNQHGKSLSTNKKDIEDSINANDILAQFGL